MQVKKTLALIALAVALMPTVPSAAQEQNLLANPGLEQPYDDDKQASGWGRWFENTGKVAGSLDYVVGPTFSAESNSAIIHGGGTSQHIGNKYDPWHAGIKQAVNVPAQTPLRFCVFGRLFANNEDFEKAKSIASINGRMKVGIFPNGETDWDNGGIVWSPEYNPHDGWQQICVEATSGDAGRVTVFTSSSYRGFAAYHLDAWWDDASLVVTAPPATTAPITAPAAPPAQAPTVGARNCETRPDGSVVYVVQSGDTLGAIAIACDSTVEEIQRLNNLSGTLINAGQALIVKGPTAPPTATPEPTPEAAPTVEASPTPTDGQVCVEAFNDANANQAQDVGEQLLGGVGFTLSDTSGIRGSYVTSGLEPAPYCFGGLQPGSYTVDARPPLGVANTTDTQWPVGLTAGMKFDVAYGGSRNASAPNVPAVANPTEEPPSTNVSAASTSVPGASSDLGRIGMGVLGVIILLGAGFMAGLALMRARR
ncbi:MAG TPA: LysM peptidoglycan-binding domain-containing protein [Anaerolineae bacterium]